MSAADNSRHAVVVGASLAGIRAVQGLRTCGHTGAITLIGAESELPYDRPPLSKDLLKSDWSTAVVEANRLITPAEIAALDIRLVLGVAATGLDLTSRTVSLADGSSVTYDVLIIATGAAARPSPWRPPSGVLQLRTLDDARAIAAQLAKQEPIVVVGGGFIGTEIAAAALRSGCPVTVVDPVVEPMARLVGPEIANVLVDLHLKNGATTLFGVGVVDIQGEQGDLTVLLDDGTSLHASSAIVGIGSIASTEWLAGSGLTIDNGVLTDSFLRAIGAEDVYAIGDVARWPHVGRGVDIRAEHWTNASDQARYVATKITGGDVASYDSSDYVWSDQYDWKVHTVGWRDPAGTSVVIGDLIEDGRVAVVHADAKGLACGAVTVNWVRVLNHVRRLLQARPTADALVAEIREKALGATHAAATHGGN